MAGDPDIGNCTSSPHGTTLSPLSSLHLHEFAESSRFFDGVDKFLARHIDRSRIDWFSIIACQHCDIQPISEP
jgi:hypothetical protein